MTTRINERAQAEADMAQESILANATQTQTPATAGNTQPDVTSQRAAQAATRALEQFYKLRSQLSVQLRAHVVECAIQLLVQPAFLLPLGNSCLQCPGFLAGDD